MIIGVKKSWNIDLNNGGVTTFFIFVTFPISMRNHVKLEISSFVTIFNSGGLFSIKGEFVTWVFVWGFPEAL